MCALPNILPCPLCAHPNFDSVVKLRDKLIYVSTHTLSCPVCHEEMSGLDKLTIHLFSHVKIVEKLSIDSKNRNNTNYSQKHDIKTISEKSQVCKRTRTQPTKNKAMTSAIPPVKFVKIYPKLPVISINTMPIIEIMHNELDFNKNRYMPCQNVLPEINPQAISRVEPNSLIVEKNINCNVCGLHFPDELIFKMHKSLFHNISDELSSTMQKFKCHLCHKYFKMRGSLMVHMRVVHCGISWNSASIVDKDKEDNSTRNGYKATGEDSSSDMLQTGKRQTLERNDSKQWMCEICEKSFTTKYFLKKHKRLHTGETPYACAQCNKTFTFQQSYHKHLLYHNDEKPHSCSFCGRSFKELSTLHNHQRIHTGEKPFSCETCGKCFRQRVSYLVHRRIHTGAMPYKCTACDKSFRYKVSQRTHKCPAQPPGTVVRQSGELLEKLKKKHTESEATSTNLIENNQVQTFSNISEANAELIRTGAKLSFEDTEAENFSLIFKSPIRVASCNNSNEELDNTSCNYFNEITEISKNNSNSIPSPSDILKNLCLNNYDDDYAVSNNVQAARQDDLSLDILYNEFRQFI